jgi:hypothetical protein
MRKKIKLKWSNQKVECSNEEKHEEKNNNLNYKRLKLTFGNKITSIEF